MRNEELYHFGVKGMKWGVRRYQNKDGTLTSEGKKRKAKEFAKEFSKQTKKDGYSYPAQNRLSKTKEMVDLYNSKELSAARKKYMDVAKLERDYWNNDSLVNEYRKVAANAAAQKYGRPYDEMLRFYTSGDGDQGDGSSFGYYLKSKGKSIREYEGEVMKAGQEYRTACKSATESLLKEYGNTPVKVTYAKNFRKNTTVSQVVEDVLDIMVLDELYPDSKEG